jgi:hypothetical protein
MDRWWQLGRHAAAWIEGPAHSPAVLVGVHGRPGAQFVIGAVEIDASRWSRAPRDGALLQVPTGARGNLDALHLRGRRIASDARIRFGPRRHQFFVVLRRDGRTVGGYPTVR